MQPISSRWLDFFYLKSMIFFDNFKKFCQEEWVAPQYLHLECSL